jgi:hypothetical protein
MPKYEMVHVGKDAGPIADLYSYLIGQLLDPDRPTPLVLSLTMIGEHQAPHVSMYDEHDRGIIQQPICISILPEIYCPIQIQIRHTIV